MIRDKLDFITIPDELYDEYKKIFDDYCRHRHIPINQNVFNLFYYMFESEVCKPGFHILDTHHEKNILNIYDKVKGRDQFLCLLDKDHDQDKICDYRFIMLFIVNEYYQVGYRVMQAKNKALIIIAHKNQPELGCAIINYALLNYKKNYDVLNFRYLKKNISLWKSSTWYMMNKVQYDELNRKISVYSRVYLKNKKFGSSDLLLTVSNTESRDHVIAYLYSHNLINDKQIRRWRYLNSEGIIIRERKINSWGQLYDIPWADRLEWINSGLTLVYRNTSHANLTKMKNRPHNFHIIKLPFKLDILNSCGLLTFLTDHNVQGFPCLDTYHIIVDHHNPDHLLNIINEEYNKTLWLDPLASGHECFSMLEYENMDVFHRHGLCKVGQHYYSLIQMIEHINDNPTDPLTRRTLTDEEKAKLWRLYRRLKDHHKFFFNGHLQTEPQPKLMVEPRGDKVIFSVQWKQYNLILNILDQDDPLIPEEYIYYLQQDQENKIINTKYYRLCSWDKTFLLHSQFYIQNQEEISNNNVI